MIDLAWDALVLLAALGFLVGTIDGAWFWYCLRQRRAIEAAVHASHLARCARGDHGRTTFTDRFEANTLWELCIDCGYAYQVGRYCQATNHARRRTS